MEIIIALWSLWFTWIGWYFLTRRRYNLSLEPNKWLDIISRRINTATTVDDLLDILNEIEENYPIYGAGSRSNNRTIATFRSNIISRLKRIHADNNI